MSRTRNAKRLRRPHITTVRSSSPTSQSHPAEREEIHFEGRDDKFRDPTSTPKTRKKQHCSSELRSDAWPGALIPGFTRLYRPSEKQPARIDILVVLAHDVHQATVILKSLLTNEKVMLSMDLAMMLYYENLIRKQARVPKHPSWSHIPNKGVCEICFDFLLPSVRILLCCTCPAMFHYTCFGLTMTGSSAHSDHDGRGCQLSPNSGHMALLGTPRRRAADCDLRNEDKEHQNSWKCPYCEGVWSYSSSINSFTSSHMADIYDGKSSLTPSSSIAHFKKHTKASQPARAVSSLNDDWIIPLTLAPGAALRRGTLYDSPLTCKTPDASKTPTGRKSLFVGTESTAASCSAIMHRPLLLSHSLVYPLTSPSLVVNDGGTPVPFIASSKLPNGPEKVGEHAGLNDLSIKPDVS